MKVNRLSMATTAPDMVPPRFLVIRGPDRHVDITIASWCTAGPAITALNEGAIVVDMKQRREITLEEAEQLKGREF